MATTKFSNISSSGGENSWTFVERVRLPYGMEVSKQIILFLLHIILHKNVCLISYRSLVASLISKVILSLQEEKRFHCC